MPASTLDPVNAALRTALSSKGASSNGIVGGASSSADCGLDAQIAGCTKKALLANIDFEPAVSYQNTVLDKLKSKYIVLKAVESSPPSSCKSSSSVSNNAISPSTSAATSDYGNGSVTSATSSSTKAGGATLLPPRRELYSLQAVQLGWSNATSDWTVGAGMVNMGNTCYLNSTLQALFHVPALVNWLMADREHMGACDELGSCIICAMCKTLQESQKRETPTIRPHLIVNKLRLLCRNFLPGRQEDAHEFLRYLVEAMEKSFLNRFKHLGQLDARTKETTPLNQILGGYLRSAVRCLQCSHISTTFQHFQDLLLDIRKAQTLEEALDGYFSREKLDDESYHCEACQKKVPATKQFSLERAPMVLCIQLKRFSVTNNKISKHLQFRQRLDLTRFSRTTPQRSTTPLVYRLVAMVTHMGPAVSCGHYTAVAQAPCGNFYQFDDSMVRPISQQAVFNTNAYIMFYELESAPFANSGGAGGANKTSCTITSGALLSQQNGYTSSKPYGPELPPTMNGIIANGVRKKAVMIASGDAGGMTATPPVATLTSSSKVVGSASMPLLNGGSKLVQTIKALGDKTNTGNTSSSSSTFSTNHILGRPIPSIKKPPLTPAPVSPSPLRQQPMSSQPPPLIPAPTSNKLNQLQLRPSTITATTKLTSNSKANGGTLKLVPYETDDDDEEDDEDEDEEEEAEDEDETSGTSSGASSKGSTPERPTVGTKATNKDWQVVGQTADVTPARLEYSDADRVAKNHNGKQPTKPLHPSVSYPHLPTASNTTITTTTSTTDLLRLGGHSGYGQPVATWSGTRSTLDRQVAQERREERKRGADNDLDAEMDAGRMKQLCKNGNGGGNGIGAVWTKSNPEYNPIQEYHNVKNWNKQTGTYNRSFYSGNKHRNNNRRNNFHQKNGYHNKNRYRP